MYRVHIQLVTNAAPHSLPTPSVPQALRVAELNLRGVSFAGETVVTLVDGELPVATLELNIDSDPSVWTLRVRVELPERCNYTLKSPLYATSVEHVDGEGRSLPLDADLQLAVCAWAEGERAAREEIERAWALAERWEREANTAAAAE